MKEEIFTKKIKNNLNYQIDRYIKDIFTVLLQSSVSLTQAFNNMSTANNSFLVLMNSLQTFSNDMHNSQNELMSLVKTNTDQHLKIHYFGIIIIVVINIICYLIIKNGLVSPLRQFLTYTKNISTKKTTTVIPKFIPQLSTEAEIDGLVKSFNEILVMLDNSMLLKKHMENIFKVTPSLIILADSSLHITNMNDLTIKLLKIKNKNLSSYNHLKNFFPSDQWDKLSIPDKLTHTNTVQINKMQASILTSDYQKISVLLSIVQMSNTATREPFLICAAQDMSEREQYEKKLYEMAHHDSLTFLPNRRYFEQTLTREIAKSQKYNSSMIILLIDLDNFKFINDEFGHDIGDEYLKALANLFKNNIRDTDFLARIGGDEFALILPSSASMDNATIIATKIL
ncbi:MAG: GGDEF domain-containing protein, partial [Romboutsia sp.]|nr:GGDEF domain-containing protein [Romboutsia sp.]